MSPSRMFWNDALDTVLRRRTPFAPRRKMWPPGVTDFGNDGRDQVNLMIRLGKLSPEARMIEFQCGIGLRACSLTDWFGPGALYDGIDTNAELTTWCDEAYKRRLDFEFSHHSGLDQPIDFPDESRDFIVMWDLLPHVSHTVIPNLLAESSRVMLPGGCLFVAAYLLDEAANAAMEEGRALIDFTERDARGATAADGTRAWDEEWLLDQVAEAGFKHVGIRHGLWSDRAEGRSQFDLLVARA